MNIQNQYGAIELHFFRMVYVDKI